MEKLEVILLEKLGLEIILLEKLEALELSVILLEKLELELVLEVLSAHRAGQTGQTAFQMRRTAAVTVTRARPCARTWGWEVEACSAPRLMSAPHRRCCPRRRG